MFKKPFRFTYRSNLQFYSFLVFFFFFVPIFPGKSEWKKKWKKKRKKGAKKDRYLRIIFNTVRRATLAPLSLHNPSTHQFLFCHICCCWPTHWQALTIFFRTRKFSEKNNIYRNATVNPSAGYRFFFVSNRIRIFPVPCGSNSSCHVETAGGGDGDRWLIRQQQQQQKK